MTTPTDRGVLFDFDGTLVDTFDGIVAAVQRMRIELGAHPLADDRVRPHIGWGIENLIGQNHPSLDALRPDRLPSDGAPLPIDPRELQHAIAVFRSHYAQGLVQGCRVYPGVGELCWELASQGLRLAVVSNKPERFTRQILAGKGLADPFIVVLGGDSLPTLKPDPEPLRQAAREMRLPLAACVMVGDSRLDIQAARAAQIPCCAVSWGILPNEQLQALAPDCLAHSAEDLRAYLAVTEPTP